MTNRDDTPKEQIELCITRLAGLGDGVGEHDGRPVFVPLTAVGDVVRAAIPPGGQRARLVEVMEASPDRQKPPCPHFGLCGGCSLQHLNPAVYEAFKEAIARDAARQSGADEAVVRPLFLSGAASRRRAECKVAVDKGEVTLGFLAARSHDVVAVTECKVVDAAIAAAFPAWREALGRWKKPSRVRAVQFTHADNGLDVLLHVDGRLKPADSEALRAFAAEQGIVRLCIAQEGGEPQAVIAGEPVLRLGDAAVELPVAAFLQATSASQDVMAAEVLAHCAGHERVADLYSGCGTYSLPLAQAGHRVHAYEGGAEAVTALFNAARKHGLQEQLASHTRDLYAAPLTVRELQAYDAVVVNPPRNGALPQAQAIAQSGVATVVMVSCNPATFIRDAKALAEGGYRLVSLLPVDQFTWSHHLELVGAFRRGG